MSTGPRLGSFGATTGHRSFIAPLHAALTEVFQPHVCRVCGGPIEIGELAWHRAWHVEYAHDACGYLKGGDELPHEVRKPGTFSTYWEWACPECALDSCASKKPAPRADLRCARCRCAERDRDQGESFEGETEQARRRHG